MTRYYVRPGRVIRDAQGRVLFPSRAVIDDISKVPAAQHDRLAVVLSVPQDPPAPAPPVVDAPSDPPAAAVPVEPPENEPAAAPDPEVPDEAGAATPFIPDEPSP